MFILLMKKNVGLPVIKMNFCFIKVLFFFITICALSAAQDDNLPLAKIGNYQLSEKEYIERIELTPLIGRKLKGENRKVKEDFLYSLIGEKLLAIGAREARLDTIELVKHSLIEFEKMFVRDALYKKVIIEPSKKIGEDLLSGYITDPSIVFTAFIKSGSPDEINSIYNLLKMGAPFDSIYVELSNPNTDTLTLGIGNLSEEDEAKIFNKPLNSFTMPVFLEGEWYIFSIKKKYDPVFTQSAGWEAEYKRLRKVAEERAEQKLYDEYTTVFFAGKKVNASGKLLSLLAKNIESLLVKKLERLNPRPDKIALEIIDLLQLEDRIDYDSLEMPYIRLDKKEYTLKDFIRFFRFEQFAVTEVDYNKITALLNAKTKKFIEQEMLTEEGYRLNLHKDPEVLYETNMWRDNYLFTLMRNKFLDSTEATENEYKKYYEENYKSKKIPSSINIVEILTDSLDLVAFILDELENGADIKELAGKYTQREWTKKNKGEFGYFPVTAHGEIGKVASQMEVGEIYGPLKVAKGYSIFKLIGKKDETEITTPYEKVEAEIMDAVKYKKLNDAITEYTAGMASKLNLEINTEQFDKIKISNINALVFKHLGFGGKITAVPLLTPFFEWVNEWLKKTGVSL